MEKDIASERFVSFREIMSLVNVRSRNAIYRRIARDPSFPKPLDCGFGRVRFARREVLAWLESRPRKV